MKEWFNKVFANFKKRHIVIGIALLIVTIFSGLIYFSYAFYQDRNNNLIITGSANIDAADLKVRFYLQEASNATNYVETNGAIPSNYIFNPEKSSCSDMLSITEVNKNVFSITAEKKGSCSIYLDVITGDADLVTKIYAQNADGSYSFVDKLPSDKQYIVNLKKSDCSGDAEILENGNISAKSKATCEVVYDLQEANI